MNRSEKSAVDYENARVSQPNEERGSIVDNSMADSWKVYLKYAIEAAERADVYGKELVKRLPR